MTPRRLLPLLFVIAAFLPTMRTAGQGSEVVVVYNRRLAESKDVADHYAKVRQVPEEQVIGLDVPTGETIGREDFRNEIQLPLVRLLETKNLVAVRPVKNGATNGAALPLTNGISQARIRYAVLCFGMPLRIAEDSQLRDTGGDNLPAEYRRNGAAVDSELACLPFLAGHMPLTGPLLNQLFASTNAGLLSLTNGLLMVTRLDGPTASIARALLDKAVEAESNGLWGRAYFDLRGLTNGAYKGGDDWLRYASEVCRHSGFETVVDSNETTFPSSFPLSQVAFYAGWYDPNASGPFARPTVEFMPGAFAYHLHSFSASTLRSTDRQWVGPLLARGVTITMGCVDEPFVTGTPDLAVFFDRLVHVGYSFGEAAYCSQRFLSWQTTIVGDPLYRPFGKPFLQQFQALQQQTNKLAEWAWLRLVNLQLVEGRSPLEVANALDDLPAAHQSPVVMEKLGELFERLGKPSSSVRARQSALKLEPSAQQRVRIELELAEQLVSLGREPEAYEVYQQFLKDNPNYPDMGAVYKKLEGLAGKLGHKEDAERYAHELSRLVGSDGPAKP